MQNLTIKPIIGFEVHVQLATRSKLFCGCAVEFGAAPNSRVCPVCLALPGALPVLNSAAYELAVKAATALGCAIGPMTKWDRKSYFYPDLPKNYQISQYDLPVGGDGAFDIPRPDGTLKRVGIIRAHLEEDAGKNQHEGLTYTRVDLNRCGTPLLEIVTQPDIADADEAYAFCVELQRLVRFLGISTADMQKGQMRFEPNINVAITTDDGREFRTPISEVKNLNSFRSVRLAVQYEIDRQVKEWQRDNDYTLKKLGKMNFGWDDVREVTEFQRGKEESHDYRYFPDPDLVPVMSDATWLTKVRDEIGELPVARQRRFESHYGITAKDAEIILADRATAVLFEDAIGCGADSTILAKQFLGMWNNAASARGVNIGGLGMDAPRMAELANLVRDGTISATSANAIVEKLCDSAVPSSQSPREIAESSGLIQIRDESATQAWIDAAFAANPQAVADAMSGIEKKVKASSGFLRGQVMKLSGGKADPKLTGELIEATLAKLKSQE